VAAPAAAPATAPAAAPVAVAPAARFGSSDRDRTFGLIWVESPLSGACGAAGGLVSAEADEAADPVAVRSGAVLDFSLAGLVSPSRSRNETFGFAGAWAAPQSGVCRPFGVAVAPAVEPASGWPDGRPFVADPGGAYDDG
jgi:hypothetical protein